MKIRSFARVSLLAIVAGMLGDAHAVKFIALDPQVGQDPATIAYSVSGDGNVAAGRINGVSNNVSSGGKWALDFVNQASSLTPLPNLTGAINGYVGTYDALSYDGSVGVGFSVIPGSPNHDRGVIWNGAVPTDIGTFFGNPDTVASHGSRVTGVDGSGLVFLGYASAQHSVDVGASYLAPFISDGTTLTLLPVPVANAGYTPYSISSDQKIVGHRNAGSLFGSTYPVYWANPSSTAITIAPGNAGSASEISADGSTIVGYQGTGFPPRVAFYTTDPTDSNAFTLLGTTVDRIGSTPVVMSSTYANAVNANGMLICGSAVPVSPDTTTRAWVCVKSTGTMVDLYSLLQAVGVDLTEWQMFTSANDVSDDGLTIVGYGKYYVPDHSSTYNRGFAVRFAGVKGHVNLEDWYGPVQGREVTVTITRGFLTETYTVPLDSNGDYVVPTFVGSGSGTVQVKASHWLNKIVNVNLDSLGASGVDVSLVNGDIDGDNAVTIFDYSALSTHFDVDSSSPNWNTVDPYTGTKPSDSDLDGDEFVSIFDYSILSTNFDQMGD